MPKMTKRQFEVLFREEVLPRVIERYEQDGVPDRPARREAWNDTVDAYIRDRELPEAAGDWTHPSWLETWRPPRRHHATMGRPKGPAQLNREIAEALAARSGLSRHHRYLLSRRGPGGGLRVGYLTPAGWHGDPLAVEDPKLRLAELREQPAPRLPRSRQHSSIASKLTTSAHGVDTIQPRSRAGQPLPARRPAPPPHGVDTIRPRSASGQPLPARRPPPPPHGVDTIRPRRAGTSHARKLNAHKAEQRPNTTSRRAPKTRLIHVVQGNYGYSHGWEDLTAETERKEALARLREYRENEQGASFRLIRRRERIAT